MKKTVDLNFASNLNKILGVDKKTISAFIDYNDMYAIKNHDKNRIIYNNSYFILFLTYTSILMMILINRIFVKKKKREVNIGNELIFITHASPYAKFRNLNKLFNKEDYKVIYLPTPNLPSFYRHYKYNINNDNVYFLEIKAGIFGKIYGLKKKIDNVLNAIKSCDLIYDHNKFMKNILIFLVFDLISSNSDLNKCNGLLIFDYDKAPHFIPIIRRTKENGCKCIALQHGMFFGKNKFYIPPFADYVGCCSKREKEIFIDSGMTDNHVFEIGAPLQAYDGYFEYDRDLNCTYDYLILLTDVTNRILLKAQKDIVLGLIETGKKVLIRYRPASRKNSERIFSKEINLRFDVSNSILIENDIIRSMNIISFSFDAIYVSLMMGKKVHLFSSPEVERQLKKTKNISVYSDSKMMVNSLKNNKNNNLSEGIVFSEADLWNFGILDWSAKKKLFHEMSNSLRNIISN